jgi:hypothetical protein
MIVDLYAYDRGQFPMIHLARRTKNLLHNLLDLMLPIPSIRFGSTAHPWCVVVSARRVVRSQSAAQERHASLLMRVVAQDGPVREL